MTRTAPRASVPAMSKQRIRYLVEKPGAAGPRFFWQPSKALAAAGWRPQRLPDRRRDAIAKAEALNAELDAWRDGRGAIPGVAGSARPSPTDRTVRALRVLYEHDRRFTELRAKTQLGYRQNLDVIEAWAGDKQATSITRRNVETLYLSLRQRTPAKAAAVITMLRILLAFGVAEKWLAENAAERPNIRRQAPAEEQVRLWPRAAVDAFVAAADAAGSPSVGTAVFINYWMGQRQGDILKLAPAAIADGAVSLRQSKTGARVTIPSLAFAERLQAELARQAEADRALTAKGATPLPKTTLLVCEATGRAWNEHHFRHVFGTIRAALAKAHPSFALPDGTAVPTLDLQFMHLRHTAVTVLFQAGCTAAEIAGITGHSLSTVNVILARYFVRTRELAENAMAKRLAYEAARAAS